MRWPAVITIGVDACCVIAFVAIGRHTHHDGATAAGIWHTAWPFLAGLTLGLVLAAVRRWPATSWPAGLAAWIGAAGAGMAIRVAAGQGTAPAFIAVAFAFLALFLFGWRAVVFSHRMVTSPDK